MKLKHSIALLGRAQSRQMVIGILCTILPGVMSFDPSALARETEQATYDLNCTSTLEFVTALEFLRTEKTFAIKEADVRSLASKVSSGCSGSALRFIRIVQLMSKAGMGSKDALELGLEFSKRRDRETETFITVFQH